MADNQVQHHVHHAMPIQTTWGNAFDQDQSGSGISLSPWRKFPDGKARNNWSVFPVPVNGTVTAISGILEGTFDGVTPFTIATFTSISTLVNVQNINAAEWRAKITSLTLGTAEGVKVGVGASGT